MPVLGGLLLSLFGGFASFLAGFMAVKTAKIVAALAAFTALNVALWAAAAAIFATLGAVFPTIVMTGVWVMVPDNATVCLSARLAWDTALALHRWNGLALDLAVKAAA